MVEGGYENINFDTINEVKDLNFKNKLIDKMLEDGVLTGAEYYVLTNNKENILKGLDNRKIHRQNLTRLAEIIENGKKYEYVLKNIYEEIKVLNNRYLNRKNIKFSKILEKYKNGKIRTEKFYKILFEYAKEINNTHTYNDNSISVFTADYPNISKYLKFYRQNSDINFNLVKTQLSDFLILLKNKLPYKEYKNLISATDNFSDVLKFSRLITKYCENGNINLSQNFKELNKFIEEIKFGQNINFTELLKEENKLSSAIRKALSSDNTEYEISCISDFFNYFEQYLKYSLTDYQWAYYKENFNDFEKLYLKYAFKDDMQDIRNDFNLINSYYETNNKRNEIFLEKIAEAAKYKNIKNETIKYETKERSIEKILKSSDKIIVVVAGGFHSRELSNELKKMKINSLTIMPKITTHTNTAKTEYEENIITQNKILSQALALRIAASAQYIEQQEMLIGTALKLAGKDNIKYVENMLDNKIKIEKLEENKYAVSFKNNQQITIDISETNKNNQNPEQEKILTESADKILNILKSFLPKDGLKSVFVPETYQIIKSLSLKLFELNIYLSDGVIFDIENSEFAGQALDCISPEVYSAFLPEVQRMLLRKQQGLLSSDRKIKFLNFIGIRNFEKQQEIISAWEYPQIILGMFFPKIRKRFKKAHSSDIEEKLSALENKTSDKIKEVLKLSVEEIKELPFFKRLFTVSKILTNRSIKVCNRTQHLILNGVDKEYINNINFDKSVRNILLLTFAIYTALVLLWGFNPLTHFLLLYPINNIITILWSFGKENKKIINSEEKYESKYFSNIPEPEYEYSEGEALGVTVQIPVYTEANNVIFETIRQSLKAVEKYKQKSGAKANVLISEDGLAPLLGGDISKEHIEHIEQLLAKADTELTEKEKQAVERIRFYREHNISFVARPKENRAGLFKKASNLNHTYTTIDKLKKQEPVDHGTYYEGSELEVYDLILMLDKDSQLDEDVILASVPKFIKDKKLAYTQNLTISSNYDDNYFTRIVSINATLLHGILSPANAISGDMVMFRGHNGFVRTAALKEINYWTEDRVSEDYYTSTKLFSLGYHGKLLAFKGYEFKEMVSRSYIEEFSKMVRYTFGIFELFFNKNKKDGLLTDWLKDFVKSKNITWYQKISFFIYPLSYINIISIIPLSLKKLAGINSFPLSLGLAMPVLVFVYIFHNVYKNIGKMYYNKNFTFAQNIKNILAVAFMFSSFSYIMIKGLVQFLVNPIKANFPATNVDEVEYELKESFDKMGQVFFKQNKSVFILSAVVLLIMFVRKINIFVLSPAQFIYFVYLIFIIHSFIFANIFLSPFFIHSIIAAIKNFFTNPEKEKSINAVYKDFNKYTDTKSEKRKSDIEIFIAAETKNFNKKDLKNTGLKVNGNTIWQVKSKDKGLIFVADNADVKEIAETLNGYKLLNKQIRKVLKIRRKTKLTINAFIETNGETSAMEDKNFDMPADAANEREFTDLKTTIYKDKYMQILSAA